MKKLLAAIACLTFATAASAQTPLTTKIIGRSAENGVYPSEVSAANPWVGAQIGYMLFGESKEFADNLIVSARIMHEIDLGESRFHLPVMGNFSDLSIDPSSSVTGADQITQEMKQLLMSSSGMRLGVYPYFEAVKNPIFKLVIHGEVAWKLNSLNDATGQSVNYLNQTRISGGVEMVLGKISDDNLPLTLSVAPVLTKLTSADSNLLGQTKNTVKSLELTFVLPIGPKMGVLGEILVGEDKTSSFRAGIVIATAIAK